MDAELYPDLSQEPEGVLSEKEFIQIADHLDRFQREGVGGKAGVFDIKLPASVGKPADLVEIIDKLREELHPMMPSEKGLTATVKDLIEAGKLLERIKQVSSSTSLEEIPDVGDIGDARVLRDRLSRAIDDYKLTQLEHKKT